MLLAQSDGADVINLSLGFAAGWSEDVVAVVASRIVAAGTVIVAAAGNGGAAGMYYADSPSTGLGVISVGSVDKFVPFLSLVASSFLPSFADRPLLLSTSASSLLEVELSSQMELRSIYTPPRPSTQPQPSLWPFPPPTRPAPPTPAPPIPILQTLLERWFSSVGEHARSQSRLRTFSTPEERSSSSTT